MEGFESRRAFGPALEGTPSPNPPPTGKRLTTEYRIPGRGPLRPLLYCNPQFCPSGPSGPPYPQIVRRPASHGRPWWRWGESNPRPESSLPSVYEPSRLFPSAPMGPLPTGFPSAGRLSSFPALSRRSGQEHPGFATPFPNPPGRGLEGRATLLLGGERYRSAMEGVAVYWHGPFLRGQAPRLAARPVPSLSKPLHPRTFHYIRLSPKVKWHLTFLALYGILSANHGDPPLPAGKSSRWAKA